MSPLSDANGGFSKRAHAMQDVHVKGLKMLYRAPVRHWILWGFRICSIFLSRSSFRRSFSELTGGLSRRPQGLGHMEKLVCDRRVATAHYE